MTGQKALSQEPRAWSMLARAFLCQNVAIGAAFGGFSVSVLPLQERFHASRAGASLGLTLAVLTMGLFGPVTAGMISRFGLRWTMSAGVALSGLGYLALAWAPNLTVVLAVFGLLIGPALAMFGPLASSMLASEWFRAGQGRAVGIANVPLFVALAPLAGAVLIQKSGLTAFYLALAGLHLLLLPFVLGVRDAPPAPSRAESEPAAAHAGSVGGAGVASPVILRDPMFWLMVLGGGVLSAAGIVGLSHIVALATEKGVPPSEAALLVSVMGTASIAGSLAAGALCDRIGGGRALGVAAAGLALSWALLLWSGLFGQLAAAMLLAGACAAGVVPCINVLAVKAYGVASLARVMSLYGLFTLPLTFVLPPAAATLRDMAGDYDPVMMAVTGACAAVAAIFLLGGLNRRAVEPAPSGG